MSEPDFVVIRPAADLPEGFLPDRFNGLWIDRRDLGLGPNDPTAGGTVGAAVAVPTGRFETREDGAVAEIYEVRP